MSEPVADPGSYRDPGGRVFHRDGRVFRVVTGAAAELDFVRSTGLLDELAVSGDAVASIEVDPGELGSAANGAAYVLEHPRLAFVSLPYEWPFAMLRAAALFHLDLQLRALARGVALSDASAYNVQFRGPRPVFIDVLSFRRYRDGEFWIGHRQFCEQFLNPLLLTAHCGVPYNAWYRGSPEGISAGEVARTLPAIRKLSWNVLTHVVLQAKLQARAMQSPAVEMRAAHTLAARRMPRGAFERMLAGLRRWIARLRPAGQEATPWRDYTESRVYAGAELEAKLEFVRDYARETRPPLVWDLGCNTGEAAETVLAAGVARVVGFDADLGSLDVAYARAVEKKLELLPLYCDLANPSPDQGWDEKERAGLAARRNADGVLALGLIHHLTIARNVPLAAVIDWLVATAPTGVVEFVPKADPMAQRLLRLRDDVFSEYDEPSFRTLLERKARIVKEARITVSGRRLFWFSRA